jgi:hypothetical protein
MASHEPFGHLQHKLWSKEGPKVKLAIWLPTIKSQEWIQFRCVQVMCNTPLKSSRGELQLWFKPRLDPSFGREVMSVQSPGSLNRDNFGTPLWESQEKEPFGCKCGGELQRILYGGRWWLPPSPGRGESSESKVARCRNPTLRELWGRHSHSQKWDLGVLRDSWKLKVQS